MGTIRSYKCQECGNTWQRAEGRGFFMANYYCDKCGKQKNIQLDSDELPSNCGVCDCGGIFQYESDCAVCPECKSKDVAKEEDVVALWD